MPLSHTSLDRMKLHASKQACGGRQVYDLAMEAALRAQSCGPRNLPIKGEWQWLLNQFATTYGIRDSYTTLTYLRWILMCVPP